MSLKDEYPTIRIPNNHECWYYNGKLHRDFGPALKYDFGSFEWRKNGKLNRKDGPAVVEYKDKRQTEIRWLQEDTDNLFMIGSEEMDNYNEDDSIFYLEWWIDGIKKSREEVERLFYISITPPVLRRSD